VLEAIFEARFIFGQYNPVQKVLRDPKVLQRGLAATEVSILYRGSVKDARKSGRPKKVTYNSGNRSPCQSTFPLRGITDKSNMNYSIYENRLVLKHWYLCCLQAPLENFWISVYNLVTTKSGGALVQQGDNEQAYQGLGLLHPKCPSS